MPARCRLIYYQSAAPILRLVAGLFNCASYQSYLHALIFFPASPELPINFGAKLLLLILASDDSAIDHP